MAEIKTEQRFPVLAEQGQNWALRRATRPGTGALEDHLLGAGMVM